MKQIDEIYTDYPFYGSRRILAQLNRIGINIGIKKVRSLMKKMGIEAIYPKPNLSKSNPEHKVYPYLLKNVVIDKPNQVWSTDITYIKMKRGWLYLAAVMDWYSRYVLSWELSNTLDMDFCLKSLHIALKTGKPKIFNSDQGSQFTSLKFTSELEAKNIRVSMDGRGRAFDNIFIERLWRSVKYEEVYLNEYFSTKDVYLGLKNYFKFYNEKRLHQSLDYQTPAEIHFLKKMFDTQSQ